MQARDAPASFFFCATLQRGHFEAPIQMWRSFGNAVLLVLWFGSFWSGSMSLAQQAKSSTAPQSVLSPEKAIALAEQGRCRESLSPLKHAVTGLALAETRKQVGVLGVRCALAMDDRDAAIDFIYLLNKQFKEDPDVLFVIIHVYSDLST